VSRIALGIIGTGRIVREGYLAILPLIGDIEEVFLYDQDRSQADAIVERYDSWLSQNKFAEYDRHRCENAQARAINLRSAIHVLDSADDVIRRSDAVLVTTPPKWHLPVAQACLDAGKITLIEKPLALSSVAARAFARRNHNVLDRVRYLENYPHNPAFQRVKRIVDDGVFGDPLLVSVFLRKPLPVDHADGWRLNPLESGGGVLSDWGSHTFGVALYLAGVGCKITGVSQECVRFLSGAFVEVESYALTSVFLLAQSGRPVTLLVENSWECGSEGSGPSGFWVSIALTRGRIEIHQKLARGRKDYTIIAAPNYLDATTLDVPWEFPHDSLYYSLVNSLQPRPSEYCSFSFGLQLLDLVKKSRGREYEGVML
jgi:predicted dehydrogenase